MSVLIRLAERNYFSVLTKLQGVAYMSKASPAWIEGEEVGEFRVIRFKPKRDEVQKKKIERKNVPPPRANQMPTDQDWPSVWPGQRSFHPAVVPLPVRQGYPKRNQAPPGKFANTELMKIPNFLHLTPPAIKRHCDALKQFCTEWPIGIENDEKCEKYFPLEIITSDYCWSSPSIREPLSRIVSLKIKLSSLNLNTHAKDKLLRLLGSRYDEKNDIITIVADRCPTKKQNLDYAYYLLTAVYHEAWRVEPWEAEKALADMEYYDWDKNKSRERLVTIHSWPEPPSNDLDYEKIPHVTEYKIAVSDLINNGEDQFSINKYRQSVKNLLHLKKIEN
ncbi:hypothetical protein HCN44_001242 [Aphidius gifuensis]|uniref:Small ribosomal subunit protein mS35 mitochondrial conserved domain-containing protein n=1 Tax=Aphidius gifuensis TaxID=684658 RepID=A0A835CMQ8_APHGI|nr:28S ribosomal protein S35, mitochondrial [Aphidius gifuensis]KAF7988669.1 hypothetical protein HCN44_001242 [Aphidius gifuensis]